MNSLAILTRVCYVFIKKSTPFHITLTNLHRFKPMFQSKHSTLQLLLPLQASSSLHYTVRTSGGVWSSSYYMNSTEIDNLARFAVEEHNKKENAMLKLARVVSAQAQVVAGLMNYLTLEIDDAGNKKTYKAKVWVKSWMNFKELQEFTHINEPATNTPSADHDVQRVQDAANYILKTLQQRSNSLYPYELQEVVHAKAETVEGLAKYDILLKLKRNNKEEKFKANVHKDDNGVFHLNHVAPDQS